MALTDTQRGLLLEAKEWCDDNDKSIEFMIQYMQDFSGCTHDQVIEWLTEPEL